MFKKISKKLIAQIASVSLLIGSFSFFGSNLNDVLTGVCCHFGGGCDW